MHYNAIVSKEGRAKVAYFPDCPGCQTQADPGEDIVAQATEALEGWLEAHLVHRRVPPLPSHRKPRAPAGSSVIEVGVPPSLAARVQLRVARHEAGLSQAALAKKVGVSQQQIASLESPDANMTVATLMKVAKALGHEVAIDLRRTPPDRFQPA